jgi:hypothetical protein
MFSFIVGFLAGVAAAFFLPPVLVYFGKLVGFIKDKTDGVD